MTFRFGLFRVLTFANIAVLGILGLLGLYALLFVPMMGILLIAMITPAFLHNQRCLKLQKNFRQPELPVNPGLPMAINFSSIGAFIWGIILLSGVIKFLLLSPSEVQAWAAQVVKTNNSNPDNPPMDAQQALLSIKIVFGGSAFHAVCILLNCVLSIQYSRLLRERLPEEDETV